MNKITTSKEEYYLKQQQLQEFGRVKSKTPLISRMVEGKEKVAHLNLSVSSKIKDQYAELSKWEKLFVENFFEGKPRPTGKTRIAKVREEIDKELSRLYALVENEGCFAIDYENNPDLDREFESEIKALITRGEAQTAEYYKNNPQQAKKEMAKKYAKTLYEEYKHIVDFIKSTNYEHAFKALMLRETLIKTYKKDNDSEKEKTIVKPRVEHKSIASHMTLNAEVLNTVYNELDNYSNFANLYFASIAISNKTIAGKNTITLSGVDTFGKGRWIKFEGKTSNKDKYIKNAQELAALVQDTPWCTKTLASSQLEQGDFYVFVDNAGKPHVAVKMSGNTVDEVRGLKGGNAQELEEDYRGVAVEFLQKNPKVKDGDKWLKKEEWNTRLINYSKQIKEGTFEQESVAQMLTDLYDKKIDYKTHGFDENSNLTELKKNLNKIHPQLATHFGCKEDEICCGDHTLCDSDQNLVAIMGDAKIRKELDNSLGKLKFIGGRVAFPANISDLGELNYIGGDAEFSKSSITSLNNLQSIGGDAYFLYSQIKSLGNLKSIGGSAYFQDSNITSLGNLKSIGGSAYFSNSNITSLGNLESIGKYVNFNDSKITNLSNLESIGGSAAFAYSQITNLGNLQSIGGDANFRNSKITDFGNLQYIGGIVYFEVGSELEAKFYQEFKNDGNGWHRVKIKKADDNLLV